MIPVVRWKAGCVTTILAPAGIRILAALELAARTVLQKDVTITCANEGHQPTDPHSTGEAFDIRTHDLTPPEKVMLLGAIMGALKSPDDVSQLEAKDGGYVTQHFFGWIENPGQVTEHIHVQRRNSTVYP